MIEIISEGYPYKPEKGCFGYSSCAIVKSDNKTILFDTGNYGLRTEIVKRLNYIDIVVISHLHFDHCSNLDLFINKNIPIYISKIEYDEYFRRKEEDLDLFSYFEFISSKLNLILLDSEEKLTNEVKIIFTAGHTLGHISLAVNDSEKAFLLAADALKSYNDYQDINSYGNAIDSIEYIKTKQEIIKNYLYILPGHDVLLVKGARSHKIELGEF